MPSLFQRLRARLLANPARRASPPAAALLHPQVQTDEGLAAGLKAARDALAAGDTGPALEVARAVLHEHRRAPGPAALAADLLGSIPDRSMDPILLAVRARVRWYAGDLTAAHADATASLAGRDITTTRGLLRAIEGEQRTLQPGWLPPVTVPPLPRPSGRQAPRVLHLVSASRPWVEAGFAIRTHEVGRAQLAAGLDPHIATAPGFPGHVGVHVVPRTDQLDGVTYHRLEPDARTGQPDDIRVTAAAAAFAALARELAPTVIAAAETASIVETTAPSALAVGRRLGLPVILEVRGFRDEAWHFRTGDRPSPERYALLRAADAALWSQADAVVTLGEGMREELVARGVPADRIAIVPNAIDAERFRPGERDAALAVALGIRPGEVVLGYVGSLVAYEGVGSLLDAARVLLDRGRAVHVLIVGDGEAMPDLRARVAALRLDDAVSLTGRVPHDAIVAHLHLIDVFVVPRPDHRLTRLVTPIKPVEALAAGCTVVVSDLPALRELIVDRATGRTFAAGDADDLVTVLDELVTDPDQRRRLAEAGSAWARSERTWAANGRRYRELVERLTGA